MIVEHNGDGALEMMFWQRGDFGKNKTNGKRQVGI